MSLLKELERLRTTAPEFHVDEDDLLDTSRARVTANSEAVETVRPTALRARAGVGAVERDPKYAGERVTRAVAFDQYDVPLTSRRAEHESNSDIGMTDEEDTTDSDEEMSSDSAEVSNAGVAEQLSVAPALVQTDEARRKKKGEAIRQQRAQIEQQIALRMRIQKLLMLINQLPARSHDWREFLNSDDEVKANLVSARQELLRAANCLLEYDTKIMNVMQRGSSNEKHNRDDDNESITSGSFNNGKEDDVMEGSDVEMSDDNDANRSTGDATFNTLDNTLRKRFSHFKSKSYNIARKWQQRTASLSGRRQQKNDAEIVQQIEALVGDSERLLERTRLNRCNVLPWSSSTKDGAAPEKKCELFDDTDFYHTLLNQFIERKKRTAMSSGGDETSAMTRQWLEVQKLRDLAAKKRRATIDRKGSKARRIRYEVYKRLVNFMPSGDPSHECWSDAAKDELFSSLFQ